MSSQVGALGPLQRQWLKEMMPLKPEMEGEIPRVVFRGNTGMTVWGPVLLVAVAIVAALAAGPGVGAVGALAALALVISLLIMRARVVVVTERRVHIFQAKARRKSKRSKVVTLNRPAEVRLTRFGLRLGEERKIYAVLRTGAMKEAAALAGQPPA